MSNFYKSLFLVVATITSNSSFALKGFDSSNRSIGSEDKSIEIRRENSDGTRSKIRGEVDSSGDFRGRDREGNRFRGSIDSDGYGKIRDSDGNTIKVKPRY